MIFGQALRERWGFSKMSLGADIYADSRVFLVFDEFDASLHHARFSTSIG